MARILLALVIFLGAAGASYLVAPRLAALAEARYGAQIAAALHAAGHGWARAETDGLTVRLTGAAPSLIAHEDATRLAEAVSPVLTIIDDIVEAPRVAEAVFPPRLDILKNGSPRGFGLICTSKNTITSQRLGPTKLNYL